jgi:hypothetical protein
MTVVNDPDTLVGDYLARLEAAAGVLPAERRAELVDEVRSHIADARAEGAQDEAAVRTVLDRLGPPAEIVAAAGDAAGIGGGEGAGGNHPVPEPRLRGRDIAALLLLPFGGFVFLVGWFAGVILLWSSDRWRTSEKWIGTLVLPFGYLSLFGISMVPAQVCTSEPLPVRSGESLPTAETCTGFAFSPWVGIPLFVVLLVAPALVAGVLAQRGAPGRG